MKKHIHQAEPARVGDDLMAEKGFMLEKGFLRFVQIMIGEGDDRMRRGRSRQCRKPDRRWFCRARAGRIRP